MMMYRMMVLGNNTIFTGSVVRRSNRLPTGILRMRIPIRCFQCSYDPHSSPFIHSLRLHTPRPSVADSIGIQAIRRWFRGCPKKELFSYGLLLAFFAALPGVTCPAQTPLRSVEAIRENRQELDATVWLQEREAQERERYIVRLWDSLRKSSEKLAVMEEIKFRKLTLGTLAEPEILPSGIRLYRAGETSRTLNPALWKDWLETMKKRYRLIQSEWHHSRYHPGPEAPHSQVKAVLHVTKADDSARYIIEANLMITWSNGRDARGYFAPEQIEATDIRILERVGGPVFLERLTHTAEPYEIGNLIVYDLNRDGLSEIIIPQGNLVFWNRGNLEFENAPLCAYPVPAKEIMMSLVADLTGDGRVDLLLLSTGHPILYQQDAKGHFSGPGDSIFTPLNPPEFPWAIAAGDINHDNLPDLFVAQYKPPYTYGQMPTPFYDANDGFPSYLLINLGEGRFEDRTEASGLAPKRFRRTYSASFIDLNEDGHLDLLTVNDFSGIDVYFNRGDGSFREVTHAAVTERSAFGMSHTFGDYNLDGRLDFFIAGMGSSTARRLEHLNLGSNYRPQLTAMRMPMAYGNRMYLGAGEGRFLQPQFKDAVSRSGWSWGTTTFDFNLDGSPDIYVANGNESYESAQDYCTTFWTHDIYTGDSKPDITLDRFFRNLRDESTTGASWNPFEKNVLFMNLGGGGFLNVSFLMGTASETDSRSVVSEDLDNDGRPDLLFVSVDMLRFKKTLHVYQNLWPEDNNWIGVHLPDGERFSPLGAQIAVAVADRTQSLAYVTGDSNLAQHSNRKVFGLGKTTNVDSITVRWPNGRATRIEKPTVNRYHSIAPKH